MIEYNSGRRVFLLISLALLAGALVTQAQPVRKGKGAKRQDNTQKVLQFGDIRLQGWAKLDFIIDEYATADGPNTVVDATDEPNKAKSRLQAPHLHAVMNAKDHKVERIDATGGVKYSGERAAAGREGIQLINFSGSKGTYFKSEGRVVLEGPVQYYVEQPAEKGGKQWARGVADKVTYDENKKLLRLDGHVKFTYLAPTISDKPQPPVEVEYLEIDMSGARDKYSLGPPGSITFEPKSSKEKP